MATKQTIAIAFKATDNTRAAFRSVEQSMGKLQKAGSVLNAAFAPLAGAASVAGLVAIGSRAIETADKIGKLSTRLGASTEALSQYKYVADRTGVSFETLTMGWQRMTRRIAEASVGMGEARGALAELGLDAAKLNQLAPEQQFEALADAIAQVKNPADQVRLSMKLFDSEGVALLQTIKGGSGAMREMRGEAQRLGVSLSKDQTDAAARARDAVTRLTAAWDGLVQTAATSWADDIAKTLEGVSNSIDNVMASADRTEKLQQISKTLEGLASWSPGMAEMRDRLSDINKEFALKRDPEGYAAALDRFIASFEAAKEAVAGGMAGSRGGAAGQLFGPDFDPAANLRAGIDGSAAAIAQMNASLKGTAVVYDEATVQAQAHYNAVMAASQAEQEHAEVVAALEYGYSQMSDVANGTFGQIAADSQAAAGTVSSTMSQAAMTMQNAFAGAISQMIMSLGDLENAAKSIFSMVVGTAIRLGVTSLLTGGTGGAGAVLTAASAAPVAGKSSGITVGSLNVNVAGQFSSDPVSVRRMADQLHKELQKIGTHHGPREALA